MKNIKEQKINSDLSRVFFSLRKSTFSILVFSIMGLIIGAVMGFVVIEPQYSSNVDLLVNQQTGNDAQTQFATQQADLGAINTYKDVLKKSVILQPVLNEIEKNDNYQGGLSGLQKATKISNEPESQVISVIVTDKNPYVAKDIANEIGKVFNKKIKKMMKVNNVTIVTRAKVNSKPISPNKKLYILFGFLIGMFIGMGIAIIKEYLDDTVKDVSFIDEDLGLVNLGQIYHIDKKEKIFKVVNVVGENSFLKRKRV